MKDDVLQRVKTICELKSASETQFAKLIGAKQKTINQQLRGDVQLSLSVLLLIIEAFPDISTEWLLRGSGEMLKDTQSPPSAANSDTEPKFSTTSAMYETLIKDRDEQIEELKAEVNKLIGENNVMREQLGMKERKISSKSA